MRTTVYAYPWDLARVGPEVMVDDVVDKGLAAIDLAATYHPIDAFSPRGPSLFTSPRGAVHFPARSASGRYGRIQPSFDPDPAIRAAWPAAATAAARRGIDVNAWTVVLFQPWIVDAHPQTARVLPSGDRVGSMLCPSSPDVQEYLAALCDDLCDQFEIATLRLEMVAASTFDYGWLRPRILTGLPPLARQLLNICFCPSCVGQGAAAGLEVEAIRRQVVGALDAELAEDEDGDRVGGVGETGPTGSDELRAFIRLHQQATADLVTAAVSTIPATARPRLSTMVQSPYSLLLGDGPPAALVDAIDQALVFPAADPEHARRLAATGVGLTTFVAPVDLGILPGFSNDIRATLRAAGQFPLEEVSIYNYGLLSDRDLQSVLSAIGEEFP